MKGSDEPLEVFSGTAEVSIAVSYAEDIVKDDYHIPGKVRYSASDDKRCFYPIDFL